MNSIFQDVQLKNINLDHKELVACYGHSMRSIKNLKLVKLQHTKYQAHSYFSGNQCSNSLQQFLSSSKVLFKFREILFFSLRQMFLQMQKILTVLQWMSPGIDQNTKRQADQQILKIVFLYQEQGKIGPLPQKIFIIEIERMLKVLQFDQKEITLKILFSIAKQMDCLIKADREYIFYDKFFYCLQHFFKQEDSKTITNKVEYDRKIRLETKNGLQSQGLRKIGVVNDYQEQFEDLDGEFYDSIANLLYSKGQDDYMNYVFMGFVVTKSDPIKINAVYGNAQTKCKLYLRPNLISQKLKINTPRPQSAPSILKFKTAPSSFSQQKIQKPFSIKSLISPGPRYIKQIRETHQQQLMTILDGENDILPCHSQRDISLEQTGLKKITLTSQNVHLEELPPYKQRPFFQISRVLNMFGVAKPEPIIELNSGSELEDEDFDIIDQPIYVDITQKLENQNKVKEKGWKGTQKRKSSSKYTKNIMQDEGIETIEVFEDDINDIQKLITNLDLPEAKRQIEFQFAEYEVELVVGDKGLESPQEAIIELDFTQFGFASTMIYQVYSSEYVRAIRISFPESQIQLPLIYFPYIETKEVYDLHTWHIGPIDNIKGLQIQKKKIQGLDFIKNFVFLVQDNEKSNLTCYKFEYKQNQHLYEDGYDQIMPQVSNSWRQGQFKIYLSFTLKQINSNSQLDIIVNLLKKLNIIYQQMFPGLIIEENVKKLRPNCVFEVYLQSMGRPQLRDNYDRYYLSTLSSWTNFVDDFDSIIIGLIDNLTILIWSYGGILNLHLMELEFNKRQSGKITKSYPYKYVQNII